MVTVPARFAPRLRSGRDGQGWSLLESADPRLPARRSQAWHLTGPRVAADGTSAHGVFCRDEHGLREVTVFADGWLLWRTLGPHMRPVWTPQGTPSPLISHLNPLLAQHLHLAWCPPSLCWGYDHNDWTAEAITHGLKPAGYFSLGRRANRTWHAEQTDIAVAAATRYRSLHAARAGTLAETFDLDTLAADYTRVLPAPLGDEAARALQHHAELGLLEACCDHERYHPAITGLVLGYPPETTAGSLLPRHHPRRHLPLGFEHGAHCPRCDR